MFVNNETTSKETRNYDSLHTGRQWIMEENVKESFTQYPEYNSKTVKDFNQPFSQRMLGRMAQKE